MATLIPSSLPSAPLPSSLHDPTSASHSAITSEQSYSTPSQGGSHSPAAEILPRDFSSDTIEDGTAASLCNGAVTAHLPSADSHDVGSHDVASHEVALQPSMQQTQQSPLSLPPLSHDSPVGSTNNVPPPSPVRSTTHSTPSRPAFIAPASPSPLLIPSGTSTPRVGHSVARITPGNSVSKQKEIVYGSWAGVALSASAVQLDLEDSNPLISAIK